MMKTNLKTVVSTFAVILLISGCDGFLDVNKNPNNPTDVPENLQLPGIQGVFSYEVLAGRGTRATSQWIQQTAWNGVHPSYDSYDLRPNDANPVWTNSYPQVMNNAWNMIEKAEQNENNDYAAIGRILIAWNMGIITDLYGPAPYSEAWQGADNPTPKYDSQEQIYQEILSLLRQAIRDLDQKSLNSPGSDDLVYGGDMSKWEKLAYTLKARYHMHLTGAPGYDAQSVSDSALAALSNGLESNADNANFEYFNEEGSENPWFQFAIKGSWDTRNQMSRQYIQLLKDLNDPRLPVQARPVGEVDNSRSGSPVEEVALDTAEYAGVPNGVENELADEDVSSIGRHYSSADAHLNWFNFAEAKFLEAEATYRTEGANAANPIFRDAIRASLNQLGVGDSAKNAYMNNTVANLTSANVDPLEQIITHKYIANFLHFENYNDWRRTGYPTLTPINDPDSTNYIPSQLSGDIPVRFPFPNYEVSNNRDNVADTDIPIGIQGMDTHIWWDAN